MKKTPWRFCGIATAAVMLLGQFTLLPANAADPTASISPERKATECNFTYIPPDGITIKQGEGGGAEIELSNFGASATDVITEVLVDYKFDSSQGKVTMPAFGYNADGYNENNWFQTGCYFDPAPDSATVSFPVLDNYPLPGSFQLQLWGEGGLDSAEVTAIGLIVRGGDGIGVQTRLGDVNNDHMVTVADAIMLWKYISCQSDELTHAANADMDHNNKLDARDLTLLKRGLLDGTLGNEQSGDSGKTAMEFVQDIRLGWNLGNTLDSTNNGTSDIKVFETCWGCPYTTQDMIKDIKKAGFNAVRVPVSWGQKTNGAPEYKIRDDWMQRVQTIVDWVMDEGMYCIVNIHHDNAQIDNGAYFYPDKAHLDQSKAFVSAIWKQIGARFAGYDEKLIFETLNEPRLQGNQTYEWNVKDDDVCHEAFDCINTLNATALEAIRSSGGNNGTRFVMMPGYAAKPEALVLSSLKFPENDKHLILSVHAYTPYDFALNKNGTGSWDESSGGRDIINVFETVKNQFISKGIPVIIGEFCAVNKNNEDTRAKWAEFYTKEATARGIRCFWWDNCQFTSTGENCGLYDRNSRSITYPKVMEALLKGTA